MSKYFVIFNVRQNTKLKHKLLYKTLMDKKIGKENYIIYDEYFNRKYINKYQKITYLKDYNLFKNGILIEFADKKSYSKFILSGKSVINPNFNILSNILYVKSFRVEDNFIENMNEIQNEYERLGDKLHHIECILQTSFTIKKECTKMLEFMDRFEHDNSDDSNQKIENEFINNIEYLKNPIFQVIKNAEYITKDLKMLSYTKTYIDTKTSEYFVKIKNEQDLVKNKIGDIFKNISDIFY